MRDGIVFVNSRHGYESVQCAHVGVNHAAISEEMLQNLVDYFYASRGSLPLYMGFVLYLFYERLHPSEDGNGRLGRLVFVENQHLDALFPISPVLVDLNLPEMKEIYHYFNFPRQIPNDKYDPDAWMREPEDSETYFRLHLSREITLTIVRVLLVSLLWKAAQLAGTDSEVEKIKNYVQNTSQKRRPRRCPRFPGFAELKAIIDKTYE